MGPGPEQATIKKLDVRLNQTPALLLSGDVSKISQSFDITSKEQGEVMDFTLKPKTKDTLFDSLRVSFRRGLINDMQLVDSVGQRTNILFNGVKANEAIPASKFQFKIPEGADVIGSNESASWTCFEANLSPSPWPPGCVRPTRTSTSARSTCWRVASRCVRRWNRARCTR